MRETRNGRALTRVLTTAVIIAALTLCGAGCALFGAGGPLSVVDSAGREVSLDKAPEKIVSMAPSNTEILFALGLGERVVGVTTYCNYPPEAGSVEKVGDSYAPDYEKIVALEPDLVMAVGTASSQLVQDLENYGLPVFVLQAATVDDVAGNIELAGEITGARDEAAGLAADIRERIEAVEERVARVAAENRPTVFWCLDSMLWTVGPGSFVHDLITKAGGDSIGKTLGQPYGQFSMESLLEADPDVIIIPLLDSSVRETLAGLDGWASLTAVKEGRVYEIDPDTVSRPGPRIAEAIETIAGILYPEG